MLGILVKEMFARVAVMKPHTLRGLHSRNQFSHGAGGQKGRVRVSAGLVSAEASLGAFLQKAPLSPRLPLLVPLCASESGSPLLRRT